MMSSYHYNYYYCYDYYDYPSYCCCSVLLNVFFFSLDDLLHLETSLIFSVPQKDFSNGKTKQNNPSLGYLHLSSDPHLSTSSTETSVFFDRGFHKRGSVT